MNLQPTDLLIRKYAGEESIWIAQRVLMEVCGVSEEYLWKSRSKYKASVRACDLAKSKDFLPNSGKAWRWAKQNGQYFYCIENIPNRAPVFYRSQLGDAETLRTIWENACKNQYSNELQIRFERYLKNEYRNYIEHYNDVDMIQRPALAKACAVLGFILDEKDTYPGTKSKIYNDLSPVLKNLDLPYIPHNPLRLKEKVDILENTDHSIVEIIRLPRTGNRNAKLYNDPVVYGWTFQLRSMPQNYTDAFIIRKVWEMCERTDRKKPSDRWFGLKIFEEAKTKFLTAEKRYGSSRKSNIYKGYIPFKDALFAGDCWQVDATRVNIIGHKAEDGKDRHLMVVAVRDVMSGDVLGYDFTYAESHESFFRAMKMAVQNAGYLPYEIVTDRFPGHNTEASQNLFARLEALGVKIEISHSPNAKASLERWFGTFQSVTQMGSDYYYGEGIQSTRLTAHRSPEYLAQIRKDAKKAGFDLIQAYTEAETLVEQWREKVYSTYSRKHKNLHLTPKQMHEKSEKPHILEVNKVTMSMLFDIKTEITIRNQGQIVKDILGTKYYYQIPFENYDIISQYDNTQVIISYSLDDLTEIHLWEAHGHLLKSLCSAQYFEQVTIHGPNKELGRLSQQKARKRAINQVKEQELNELINAGEEALLMGLSTNKSEANAFEDDFINRRVSGSDITPDDLEDQILGNIKY